MIARSTRFRKKTYGLLNGVAVLSCVCAILGASSFATAQSAPEPGTPVAQIDPVTDPVPLPLPIANNPPVAVPDAKSKVVPPAGDNAEFKATRVTESPDAPGPDLYYDSAAIPTVTNLPKEAGPRKPDPRKEPASKFVIVEKNYGAQSTEAQLVAADRAVKLGRYDSAVELYENLGKKNSRDPRILMGLAVAYQKNGQKESAINTYRKMLDIYPKNVDARANMLGLLREASPAEALRELIALREKDPSNPGIAAQIGLAHAELGNYEEAIRYLGMASSMAPSNPMHLYNMAVVADRAGDKQTAVDYYSRSLEADAVFGENGMLSRQVIYDRLSVLRN